MTVAGIRVPIGDADQFGVIETAADGRAISAFREKPSDPVGLPDAPDQVFASMGNYVFRTDTLIEAVSLDAKDEDSKHDLGGNIIPMMVGRGEAEVYDFADNEVPGATDRDRGYWRDVGTLDAYYDAHMDLISVHPVFNLYNRQLADPDLARAAAPGQVRVRGRRRAGPGTRSTRWSRPGWWCRAARCGARSCRRGSGSTPGARSRGRC